MNKRRKCNYLNFFNGGMNGKIQELLKLAENNIQSQIINAQTPGNIQKAVSGQNVKGTIIK